VEESKESLSRLTQAWHGLEVKNFTCLPNVFIRNAHHWGLRPIHEKVLTLLLTYKWDGDQPHPSLKSLSRSSGYEKRAIQQAIVDLEEWGFLRRIERYKDHRQIPNIYDLRPFFLFLRLVTDHSKQTEVLSIKPLPDIDPILVGGQQFTVRDLVTVLMRVRRQGMEMYPSYKADPDQHGLPPLIGVMDVYGRRAADFFAAIERHAEEHPHGKTNEIAFAACWSAFEKFVQTTGLDRAA
jgi:hypothetical protein